MKTKAAKKDYTRMKSPQTTVVRIEFIYEADDEQDYMQSVENALQELNMVGDAVAIEKFSISESYDEARKILTNRITTP